VRRYTELCEVQISAAPEIAGAGAALAELGRRGIARYVCSLTPQEPLRRLINRRGLSNHFKSALGGPATKAENLATIACAENIGPSEMVLVGDGRVDLEAARAFGCRFIGVGEGIGDLLSAGEAHILDLKTLPMLI
jgi:phosphoglycolate phosphatase-like HAD superfamily hydrolase